MAEKEKKQLQEEEQVENEVEEEEEVKKEEGECARSWKEWEWKEGKRRE